MLFRADNAEALLEDKDYLAFGIWTVVPDTPTLGNPGMTRAFVKASADAYNAMYINALTGSATYTGPATGHYATRGASDHTVDYGRFTATAVINAIFNGSGSRDPMAAAPTLTEAGTVVENSYTATVGTRPGVVFAESMIHNFMDEEGNAMAGWVVNLNSPSMINNSGSVTRAAGDVVTGIMGASHMVGGNTVAAAPALSDAEARVAALAGLVGGANLPSTITTRTNGAQNLARTLTWGTMLSGSTDGTSGALSWSGVWDGSLHGTDMANHPTGIIGRFQATAGTPTPVTTPEGRINQFADQGFAGVIGSFAGR